MIWSEHGMGELFWQVGKGDKIFQTHRRFGIKLATLQKSTFLDLRESLLSIRWGPLANSYIFACDLIQLKLFPKTIYRCPFSQGFQTCNQVKMFCPFHNTSKTFGPFILKSPKSLALSYAMCQNLLAPSSGDVPKIIPSPPGEGSEFMIRGTAYSKGWRKILDALQRGGEEF